MKGHKIRIKFSLILLIVIVWYSASASAGVYLFDGIAKRGVYPSSQINSPISIDISSTHIETSIPTPTNTSIPTNTFALPTSFNNITTHSSKIKGV